MLRVCLPTPPASIISTASLHRAHLPPHDTVIGLGLPPTDSLKPAYGRETQVKALRTIKEIPGGVGQSAPHGSIILSWALPNTRPESRAPQGLTVTCLNAVVSITNTNRFWTLEVVPADGSSVKAIKESAPATGVEVELGMFARAVAAVKGGKSVVKEEDLGSPRGTMWDVAVIQALLTSNGHKVELEGLV